MANEPADRSLSRTAVAQAPTRVATFSYTGIFSLMATDDVISRMAEIFRRDPSTWIRLTTRMDVDYWPGFGTATHLIWSYLYKRGIDVKVTFEGSRDEAGNVVAEFNIWLKT